MINAVQVALRADRWNPFAYVIAFRGVDLTGAAMHAQVRAEADASGTPVLDLPTVEDPTALGLYLISVDKTGALPISYVRVQIPETSLGTSAPSASELGDDLQLGWDMVIALPGHTQARWLFGSFTIVAGYTQLAGATIANDPAPGAADAIVAVDAAALTLDLVGTDLLGPLVAKATGAVADAQAALAQTQAVQAAVTEALVDLTEPVDELLGSPDCIDGNQAVGNTYLRQQPATVAGTLTKVQLFAKSTGTVKIKRYSVGADGSYTQTGSTTAPITATGAITLTPSDFGAFPVAAGEVLGVFSADVNITFGSPVNGPENPVWASLGGDSAGGAPGQFGAALEIYLGFTVTHRVAAATPAVIADLEAKAATAAGLGAAIATIDAALFETVTETLARQADPVAGDGTFNGSLVFGHPLAQAGTLTGVKFWNTQAGPVRITKWTRAGTTFTKTGTVVTAPKPLGLTVLGPADLGGFAVAAGEYLGFEGAYQCATVSYVNGPSTDEPGWYVGQMPTGQPVGELDNPPAGAANQQVQCQFTVSHQEVALAVPNADLTRDEAARAAKVRRPLAAGLAPRLLTDGGWNHGVSYGQSNSEGAGAGPVITVAQPYANLTFGSGPASSMPNNPEGAVNANPGTTTVIPLREFELNPTADGTHCYETLCSGEANWLTGLAIARQGLLPATHVCFGSAAGRGSTQLANLSKGSGWYPHIRSHVSEAHARAQAAGVGYALQTVSYVQGEADAVANTTTPTYLALLRQLIADLNTDLRADAGGQVEPVHMLLAQTGSGQSNGSLAGLNAINLAQIAAAKADPLIHFVTPMFPFYDPSDGLHLRGWGHLLMGRYFGRARHQLVHEKREPDWLRPVSATLRGATLTVRWDVPYAPLVLDDALAGLATDYGLRVQDDTGQIAVSGIAVAADGVSITMTLARAPGSNPVFRCGLDYLGAGMTIANGSSNNVRDSTPDTCVIQGVTHRMFHASPAFQLPIVALEP